MFGHTHPAPVPDTHPAPPPPPRLRWTAPYRQTVNCNWTQPELRQFVQPRFWLRIYLFCGIIGGSLILIGFWLAPNIVLPWPQLIIGCLISAPAITVGIAVHALVPTQIDMKPDRILFFECGGGVPILAKDLISLSIADAADGTLWLTINHLSQRERKPRTRHIAVPPSVDIPHLELLIAHYDAIAATNPMQSP